MPFAPITQCRKTKERWKEIGGDGKGHHQSKGAGISSLRVVHFLGDAGQLLVAGVEPESKSQPHSEYLKGRRVRWDQGGKRVMAPLRGRDGAQSNNWQRDENFEHDGNNTYHLNSAYIDPSNHRHNSYRDHVVFPTRDGRKEEAQIIRKENSIRAPKEKRSAPVPPARQKSPEVAEPRACPTIKAAFYRNCCGEFRCDQGDGNAPEQRNKQVKD